jgi:hypothetical protein
MEIFSFTEAMVKDTKRCKSMKDYEWLHMEMAEW